MMNGGTGIGPGEGFGSNGPADRLARLRFRVGQTYQRFLDLTNPHVLPRWGAAASILLFYILRVWWVAGYHIISYGLGLYLLNGLIGFLSPIDDPDAPSDGPELPITSRNDDEFKPFVRKLPEFKFWLMLVKATLLAFFCTFFGVLNIPVFWPILVVYFVALVFVQLKGRLTHMKKHGYLPFTLGKPRFSQSAANGRHGKD